MALDIAVSENSKPLWYYIKSKRNGTSTLVSLWIGHKELIDDASIASSLNTYFSSVFTTEDFTNLPSLEPLMCEKLNYISCTTEEILKHLKSLKTNKSTCPDRISPVILKSCAFELAPSISFLINKSFLLGYLPEDWRSADIVPLHKKGSKHLRENYRPILLTSMIWKISEKIVRDRLTLFWQDQNVIHKKQFVFLQDRSTVTQLLPTFHDFARSRNSSVAKDVLFLDLAKAFNSVPHERLLIKL